MCMGIVSGGGFSFVGAVYFEEGLFTCEWLWPGVHTYLCMCLCVCLC